MLSQFGLAMNKTILAARGLEIVIGTKATGRIRFAETKFEFKQSVDVFKLRSYFNYNQSPGFISVKHQAEFIAAASCFSKHLPRFNVVGYKNSNLY